MVKIMVMGLLDRQMALVAKRFVGRAEVVWQERGKFRACQADYIVQPTAFRSHVNRDRIRKLSNAVLVPYAGAVSGVIKIIEELIAKESKNVSSGDCRLQHGRKGVLGRS